MKRKLKIQNPENIITRRPNGQTKMERWFSLMRPFVATIAKRQKTIPRCKRCFTVKYRPKLGKTLPYFGCGGCAEMESFMEACEKFFREEAARSQTAQGRETGRGRTATGREAADALRGVLGGMGDGAHGEDRARRAEGGR